MMRTHRQQGSCHTWIIMMHHATVYHLLSCNITMLFFPFIHLAILVSLLFQIPCFVYTSAIVLGVLCWWCWSVFCYGLIAHHQNKFFMLIWCDVLVSTHQALYEYDIVRKQKQKFSLV